MAILAGFIIVICGATYAYCGLHNAYIGFLSDDALYLLMIDIYSPFIDATLPVYDHIRWYCQLPPLFPLLLALIGAGSEALETARLGVAAFMAFAHVMFYVWLKSMGVAAWHRLAIVAMHAMLPATLIHALDLWSEGLYLCFVLAALAAFRYVELSRFPLVPCLGVGVLVGCAIATRTVGIALLPALLLLCIGAPRIRALAMIGATGLFLGLTAGLGMGDAGQNYTDLIVSQFSEDTLSRLGTQFYAAATSTWHAFAFDLFQWRETSTFRSVILVFLLSLALLGLVSSIRAAKYAVVYVLGYVAIIAVWPFPAIMDRFLFPLLPMWFYFAYVGVRVLDRRINAVSYLDVAFLAVMTVLIAPSIFGTVNRLSTEPPEPILASFATTRYWLDSTRVQEDTTTLRFMQGLHDQVGRITDTVPIDECVHSVNPGLVLAKAKRAAWLPLLPDSLAAGNLTRCAYYYSVPLVAHGFPAMFPYDQLRDKAEVLAVHHQQTSSENSGSTPVVGMLLHFAAGQRPSSDSGSTQP